MLNASGVFRHGVLVFLAVALAVTYYFNCRTFLGVEPVPKISERVFAGFSGTFEQYKQNIKGPWRSRLFSNYLAGRFVGSVGEKSIFGNSIGLWNGIWFFFCCLAYIVCDAKRSLVLVFGTFAALYYSFTPITGIRIYPWDMPAIFGYILIYASYSHNIKWMLVLTTLVGIGFKETLALGCVIALFWEDIPKGRRLLYFFCLLAACIATKAAIDFLAEADRLLFTMSYTAAGPLSIARGLPPGFIANLASWFMIYPNNPVFINAGTFVVSLILPIRDRSDKLWKLIGLLFLAGNMVFGIITEYRIFHEMIPVSLWAILKAMENSTFSTSPPKVGR